MLQKEKGKMGQNDRRLSCDTFSSFFLLGVYALYRLYCCLEKCLERKQALLG